jgi:hypothetical protein
MKYKLPKVVILNSCFTSIEDTFSMLLTEKNLTAFTTFLKIYSKQKETNKKYGLKYPNNMIQFTRAIEKENRLVLCSSFKELHPRGEKLNSISHFIGCCVSDQVESSENENLLEILIKFQPKNPVYLTSISNSHTQKLIYVSLENILQNNFDVFEKIIEAFFTFDNQSNIEALISNDLKVVFSIGKYCFGRFKIKIDEYLSRLPFNILILPFVPHLELLKRASLFIFDAETKSICETIHFGVPFICLPTTFDQQLVSSRICNKLKLGKSLNVEKLSPNEMRNAIHRILENPKYLRNILKFSEISQQCNGVKNGSTIISDYLKD